MTDVLYLQQDYTVEENSTGDTVPFDISAPVGYVFVSAGVFVTESSGEFGDVGFVTSSLISLGTGSAQGDAYFSDTGSGVGGTIRFQAIAVHGRVTEVPVEWSNH